jgi:SAM-dependent methyltransferase
MRRPDSAYRSVAEAAARRYAPAGRFAMRYALGKLRHDPVFAAILAQGLIPDRARVVDLGCGQGLLLALLVAANDARDAKSDSGRVEWPADWPAPPRPQSMVGIDAGPRAVALARIALGGQARIAQADLRTVELPACDTIALIDVLHYVDAAAQEAALARCAQALSGGGVILLRVNDAGAGWSAMLTRVSDRIAVLARDRKWPRLHDRPLADWIGLLERVGFEVCTLPASAGTPFANSLLVGRRR